MNVSDERSVDERFPAGQAGVRRDLDEPELELSGETAPLTARMTSVTATVRARRRARLAGVETGFAAAAGGDWRCQKPAKPG